MVHLWISIPDSPERADGDSLGVDIGYNKLLADSDGVTYGTDVKKVCEKICRKKPGSKGKKKARLERDQYINFVAKQLPWKRLKMLAIEDLKNLKNGKSSNSTKRFRKRIAPWSYRHVLARIAQLAQENRVLLVAVDPRNTSRRCPICETVAKENRVGEKFLCRCCGHTADADVNGARNILAKTTDNSRHNMVAESYKA